MLPSGPTSLDKLPVLVTFIRTVRAKLPTWNPKTFLRQAMIALALAMLAAAGFMAQELADGKGILEHLSVN